MKILRVISSVDPKSGGPVSAVLETSAYLEAFGHKVDLVSLDKPTSTFLNDYPFKIFALGQHIKFKYRYNTYLKNWLSKHVDSYDMVIIEGLWQNHSRTTSNICVINKVNYCVVPHGMLTPWYKKNRIKFALKLGFWLLFERKVINRASHVLFSCKQELLAARTTFPCYKANAKVSTLGCSGPPLQIEKSIFVEPYFLFLGRLDPIKGLERLIEGYYLAQENTKNQLPRMVIVGPGDDLYLHDLLSLVEKHKLQDSVIFHGSCFGNDKWTLIRNCEALILPSFHENFGMVICEAMSVKKAVLISKYVNISNEVHQAGAGLVFDNTPEDIAKTINKYWALKVAERERMGQSGYNYYDSNLTANIAAKELEKILKLYKNN